MADGLCECGCGERTAMSLRTSRTEGKKLGEPNRFVNGHSQRMPRRRTPLAQRLAEKVVPATDLSPNGMAGCLLWTGTENGDGYGKIHNPGGQRYVHILALELAGRPVPTGLHVDHLCRRPACVNVDHLEAVTCGENTRRGAQSKLGVPQVLEIRELRRQGWAGPWIAAAYGVSTGHVSAIEHRRVWTDV